MPAADEILISRAIVDNDTQAFDVLVQRHQSRVRGWLRHLSKDALLADDLAQETFLLAWRKLPSYKAKGSFEAWLLTIARNQFLQNVRKTGRESDHLDRYESEASITADSGGPRHNEGANSDAEKLLAVLNHEERDVMILVYGMGYSHSEASVVADLPLGTVKSHVRRSVVKIREHFGLKGFGND